MDLAAVRHNLRLAQEMVGPEVGVAAVVKADAYGHGAAPVARAARAAGAVALIVANAEEGVELRRAGLDAPILLIGASLPEEAEAIVAHGLAASLSPPSLLDAIRAEAVRQRRQARVHLMVDLGMRRDGVTWDEAVELAARLREMPEVELEGVASHFPTADSEDTSFSERQIAEFARLLAAVSAIGLRPRYAHLAASAAVLRLPRSHFNLVRLGILLYGMSPLPCTAMASDECRMTNDESMPNAQCRMTEEAPGASASSIRHSSFRHSSFRRSWRPVLSWRARVVYLRSVAAGTAVGYGHTYVTPRATVLATLPVGYYDGYLRAYSNNADVVVRGRRAPVVGRVSMDYITVDVGGVPGVAVGDVATLIGRDGEEWIRAEELAERRGTIPYEVTCAIGPRVRRIYADEAE